MEWNGMERNSICVCLQPLNEQPTRTYVRNPLWSPPSFFRSFFLSQDLICFPARTAGRNIDFYLLIILHWTIGPEGSWGKVD